MGFQGLAGTTTGPQGNQGNQGYTGPAVSGLTSYTTSIAVSGSLGGSGSNTVQSSVPVGNIILLQGFAASVLANVVGITDLFVTSGSPNWNITLGVAFASGISNATYTIYYYGS
jgi:hypothetical protein